MNELHTYVDMLKLIALINMIFATQILKWDFSQVFHSEFKTVIRSFVAPTDFLVIESSNIAPFRDSRCLFSVLYFKYGTDTIAYTLYVVDAV